MARRQLGGDEFAIAVLDAPDTRSSCWKSELRALSEESNKSRTPFTLSLSIGVVECDTKFGGAPIEELLENADSRMYEIKRHRKSGAAKAVTA